MKMPKLICYYKCRACGEVIEYIIDDIEELSKGIIEENGFKLYPMNIVDPSDVYFHECKAGGMGICDIVKYEFEEEEEEDEDIMEDKE